MKLIAGILCVVGGLAYYQYRISRFPPKARTALRKAMYIHENGGASHMVPQLYNEAIQETLLHKSKDSPEVTGIMEKLLDFYLMINSPLKKDLMIELFQLVQDSSDPTQLNRAMRVALHFDDEEHYEWILSKAFDGSSIKSSMDSEVILLALERLGNLYLTTKRPDWALTLYSKSLEIIPKEETCRQATMHQNISTCFMSMDLKQAIKFAEIARRLSLKDCEECHQASLLNLSDAHKLLGHEKEAQYFKQLIQPTSDVTE